MIEIDDWENLLDMDAIAAPDEKLSECEYFIALASTETNVQKFRWLISAFLGAAYSFFEIFALGAHQRFMDPFSGASVEDAQALDLLRRYVTVTLKSKRTLFVKTGGSHPVTEQLYAIRRSNTHHVPLSIMTAGPLLPEDFHFGHITGKGTPVLAFCREVMSLMYEAQQEVDG